MNSLVTYTWIVVILLITIYSILKEREELGCYRISIAKQCDEENSVYVKNTKMEPTDTFKTLYYRMISILSYHEKAGVWRRCFILGTVLLIITYMFLHKNNTIEAWISLHIVFVAILYFFFNYINYHHFRHLKENGTEILDAIVKQCKP